jgi:hypothetical protein
VTNGEKDAAGANQGTGAAMPRRWMHRFGSRTPFIQFNAEGKQHWALCDQRGRG